MTLSASSWEPKVAYGRGPGSSTQTQAAVVQRRQLVVSARERGGGHGVGVGDGQGIGSGVDAGMKGHLGGGGKLPVHDLPGQVDDRDHLGGNGGQVGSGRGDRDQVPAAERRCCLQCR